MPGVLWKRITVQVPVHMEEVLSDYFITLTGRGVSSREGNGDVLIDAFLDAPSAGQLKAVEGYLADLVRHGDLPEGTTARVTEVPEEDWMSVFRSQHHAVVISDRLVVRPEWCDPVGPGDLVLDPGMAFGTGSHATTRMCLELLDWVTRRRVIARLFDLGTGSGILAIAGAGLGAKEVLAVDIDPVAVRVARENAEKNGVGEVVRVEEGGIEQAEGVFDLVTANLSGKLLERLYREIAGVAGPSGHLILSGIMAAEKETVLGAFTGIGFKIEKVLEEENWVAILLQKKGPGSGI